MKIFYKLIPLFIIPLSLLFYAYHTGSPGGYSGSNGDGKDCTNCHQPGPTSIVDGWITTDIPAEGYTPGETYTITATGTHTGVVRFGFELTAENGSSQKTGTFSITDAARTQLTNGNHAVMHTAGGIAPSGDSNTWTMDWTAPAVGTGSVTFTAAFNAANGNGNNSGDVIYKSLNAVSEFIPAPAVVAVNPTHAEQGWQGTVTITGEHTSWLNGVFDVFLINHDNGAEELDVSNIMVINDTELTVDVSIATNQLTGLYDVQVSAAVLENAFTVDLINSVGDDLLADKIKIYPNPAVGYLDVDLPQQSVIKVFDLTGRQVIEMNNTSVKEKVNVSSLESGIYFILVENEGQKVTKKFFKN
jgi:hypothetical protein